MTEFEMLQKSNVLWGKTLVACGDSFTEGDFNGWKDEEGREKKDSPVIYDSNRQMYKTYPWWIAERNNMQLRNYAKCGGTIALPKEYLAGEQDINYRKPFSHETYKNLGNNADYITIMYGLNDAAHTHLGTIDDTTNETFYGAFNVVYPYLMQKYPMAKIGAIVCNGGLKAEYRNAVIETAVKWGIPYLDLQGDTGISATLGKIGMCEEAKAIRDAQFKVTPTNGHPNELAHQYMSTYVEDFLRRI